MNTIPMENVNETNNNYNYDDQEIPHYEQAFPQLESNYDLIDSSDPLVATSAAAGGGGGNITKSKVSPFKSTIRTESIQISPEERIFPSTNINNNNINDNHHHHHHQQHQNHQLINKKISEICIEVAKKCSSLTVEFNESKSGSLNLFITGRESSVLKAKRMLIRQLQVQCVTQVNIPKVQHKFLLGPKGALNQEMEFRTMTKIIFPSAEDDNNTDVTIIGSKDCIVEAKKLLLIRSEELSKITTQTMKIPHKFHAMIICRQLNVPLYNLIDKTLIRVAVPPGNLQRDELIISGDRHAVKLAVQIIHEKYCQLERECQTFIIQMSKEKHKYIFGLRGRGIQEILEQTGVLVNLPGVDEDSCTITLFGPGKCLTDALSRVFAKASSVKVCHVSAPAWLHRFIIGKKGATLENLKKDVEKTHLAFDSESDDIRLEGPPDEVDDLAFSLQRLVDELKERVTFTEIDVEPHLHKHIIGKDGANVRRLHALTGVVVTMQSNSKNIRLEGTPEGVAMAKLDIALMLEKIANTKTKDLIMNHRFIPLLIGSQGKNIRQIKEKYPTIILQFPPVLSTSDIVTIRGLRQEVDAVAKEIMKLYHELVAANFEEIVHIPKEFHRFIIGKEGVTIREIIETTKCRLTFSEEENKEGMITVTGHQSDVQVAVKMIQNIYDLQRSMTEIKMEIPNYFHKELSLRMDLDESVYIRFPSSSSSSSSLTFPTSSSSSSPSAAATGATGTTTTTATSKASPNDTIFLRGPRDRLTKMETHLLTIVNQLKQQFSIEEIKVEDLPMKLTNLRTKLQIIRDNFNVQIHPDVDVIRIFGDKEIVLEAKKQLEIFILESSELTIDYLTISNQFRRHFTRKRCAELARLSELYHVNMNLLNQDHIHSYSPSSSSPPFSSTPPSSPNSSSSNDEMTFTIFMEGKCENVKKAKKQVKKLIFALKHAISHSFIICIHHRSNLLTTYRQEVATLANDHNVHIQLPDKVIVADVNSDVSHPSCCCHLFYEVLLTGLKQDVEMVKTSLMKFTPVEINIPLEVEFHSIIIGAGGKVIHDLRNRHQVEIIIPPVHKNKPIINVIGISNESVNAVKQEIEEIIEKVKLERSNRNHSLIVNISPKLHSSLIGPGGSNIAKIRDSHKVSISIPKATEQSDKVTIRGLKSNVESARDELLEMVCRLESFVTGEVKIPSRVHRMLIGAQGNNLKRIKKEFNDVDIVFPDKDAVVDGESDVGEIVFITGEPTMVDRCSDYLINLANQMLMDIRPRLHSDDHTNIKYNYFSRRLSESKIAVNNNNNNNHNSSNTSQ